MKKWKIIKVITICILILALIYIIVDAIVCLNMKYPHPMLGIDAFNWLDQFGVDIIIFLFVWGIPLIIDVVLLIVSTIKIKNSNNQKTKEELNK